MVSRNNISRYQEMTQQILESNASEEESQNDSAVANQHQKNGQQRVVKPENNSNDNMILAGLDNTEVVTKLQMQHDKKKDTFQSQ